MKLLFVRSQLLGSKLIRWGLRESCSHFAVEFGDLGVVFESKLQGGAQIHKIEEFHRTHETVHTLAFTYPQDTDAVFQTMMKKFLGDRYDFYAFFFWCKCVLANRLFGTPIPKKNLWAKHGYNMCTELASGIEWIRLWAEATGTDLEMIGPETLYFELLRTGNFTVVPIR